MTFSDQTKQKWIKHKGVQKLEQVLNLKETCGYVTFVNTGVPDIGCEQFDEDVHLIQPKRSNTKERRRSNQVPTILQPNNPESEYIVSMRWLNIQLEKKLNDICTLCSQIQWLMLPTLILPKIYRIHH